VAMISYQGLIRTFPRHGHLSSPCRQPNFTPICCCSMSNGLYKVCMVNPTQWFHSVPWWSSYRQCCARWTVSML